MLYYDFGNKITRTVQNNEINYLTDADLDISGSTRYDYQKYSEQIREEYSLYLDFMYNNGRKALQHFL